LYRYTPTNLSTSLTLLLATPPTHRHSSPTPTLYKERTSEWFTDKVLVMVVESWNVLKREQFLRSFFRPALEKGVRQGAGAGDLNRLFLPHKSTREVVHAAEYKYWHQHYQAELHRLRSGRATKVVMLRGLVYHRDDKKLLLERLNEKCSEAGTISSVELIHPSTNDVSGDAAGAAGGAAARRIHGSTMMIEYEKAESAVSCIKAMHGCSSCADVDLGQAIVAEYGGSDPRQYGQSWAGAGAGAEVEQTGVELAFPDGIPRAVPFPPERGVGASDQGKQDILMAHAMAMAWYMAKQVR
jgi:hypothetical protein